MKAREYYLAESQNHKFVHKFVPWVAEQLGITELPEIRLLDQPINTSFGQYDPETQSLSIVIANRNPIDVLRTLAHELTHHKQNLEGKLAPGAGETGTPQENEANANAGVIMRDFAQDNPEYFGLEKSSITEEAFNGIDITLEIQKDDEYVDDDDYDNQVMYVTASSNGRELGHVLFSFDGDELLPQDLEVEERYRGQGIAQIMYDYVKSKGYKIRRSGQQTDAGAGFWAKHRPEQNVWEETVDEGKIIHPDRINLYLNLRRPNAKPIQIAHNIPYKAMDAVIQKIVDKYSNVEADMFEFRPARSLREDSVDDKKHHSELIDSLENWMAMEYNFQDIETILMSPESRPFTRPPAGVQWVYRAIVPRSRRLNSIKARGPVVAYATKIEGAIEFVRGLDTIDPWLIVRKPFNPADMLLDFTAMYETIVQPDAHSRYAVEHEVWMRSTPAYNKATKQEVVLTSAQFYESIDHLVENFADGKNPGRKGLAKRSGVNTKASVSSLRKTAKHSTGEKARMAHWLANMKAGKKKHAKEDVDEAVSEKKLVIFDIDDTLVTTNTKVGVVRNGKTIRQLDSHEFTLYKKQPDETFDFGAFRNAKDFFQHAQPIAPMIEQLKNDIATGNRVVMITARSDFDNKEIFLKTFEQWHVDMSKVHVYRAGNDTDPVPIDEKKARIIRRLLTGYPYNKAIMYDDSRPNLESFLKLRQEYPNTRFYAWHVDRSGHATEYARAVDESLFESEVANQVTDAVIDFYQDEVGEVAQQPVDNYVEQAQALLAKADPSIREQVKEILVKAKTNPYIQGGVITTIGTLLTGGLLHIAQNVQLSPAQTNMLLQAVLNTVIPTVVSRVNGKNWVDTVKYTLASAGIGIGISTISEDEITEIENLQSYQYTGGKDVLKHPRYTDPRAVNQKNIKPLPGGSGLNYATIDNGRFLEIRILDQSGQEAVGQLKLMRIGFPINNAYQVSTVTVDEDYRGQGIAKALYGVALSILKITLLAGSQQTPGGKRNWMSLAQIPGVEVRGYVELENSDLKYKKLHKQKNPKDLAKAERRNAIVDKNIDIVMGRLGGDYLGEDEDGNMIFAFDVVPGTGSLTPAVKTELSKLYHGEYDMLYVTGLYAQWRGA